MPPLRPMVARPAAALPEQREAGRMAFEPKFGGFLN